MQPELDAYEIQALIKHHCRSIIETIESTGIAPSRQEALVKTWERVRGLIVDLGNSSREP